MKPKPILFSTPMVQAYLEDRKTMTRRIMKPQPVEGWMDNTRRFSPDGRMFDQFYKKQQLFWIQGENGKEVKAKYQPGDILWVRETWSINDFGEVAYRADGDEFIDGDGFTWIPKWKPSIHMPYEAARIFLEVTEVRAERLQDITEEDAKAEGALKQFQVYPEKARYRFGFVNLWESINGPGSWDANPWVFVYEFKRIEKP